MKKLDEATGRRVKIMYRDQPTYLLIFPEAKEIFISSIHEADAKTISGLDLITRLLSLSWQSAGFEAMIDQVSKSKRTGGDIASILHGELTPTETKK